MKVFRLFCQALYIRCEWKINSTIIYMTYIFSVILLKYLYRYGNRSSSHISQYNFP